MQFTQILLVAAVAVGAYAAPGGGYGSTPPSSSSTTVSNTNTNTCSEGQTNVCCSNQQTGAINVNLLGCVPVDILGGGQCVAQQACCQSSETNGGDHSCTDASTGSAIKIPVVILSDLL